jgi:hypothetical protein
LGVISGEVTKKCEESQAMERLAVTMDRPGGGSAGPVPGPEMIRGGELVPHPSYHKPAKNLLEKDRKMVKMMTIIRKGTITRIMFALVSGGRLRALVRIG